MKTFRGVLVTCEPAIKQILLRLDREFRNRQEGFIYVDLDDTHVFMDPNYVATVQRHLDDMLEENCYKLTDATLAGKGRGGRGSKRRAGSEDEYDYDSAEGA